MEWVVYFMTICIFEYTNVIISFIFKAIVNFIYEQFHARLYAPYG